jgi:hypothetical protein
MSLDEQYRDKIQAAAWTAIIEASMTTGPEGTRAAVLKSGEIIEALLWIQATVLTTSPEAAAPDRLRAFSSKMARRLRALTRSLRREGAASAFDVRPAAPH